MHVLVAVDESDPARAAVEHAVTTYPDADITAVHVVNPSMALYHSGREHDVDEVVSHEKDRAESIFDEVRELAADRGVSLETEVVVGSPARDVVEYAANNGVDHVVVGSHGRSGVSRVLLGSVAERVVRRAPVPVTVVR